MTEVDWPMGMDRDLSTRPLVFNPKGFLVTILESDEAAYAARTSLLEGGFESSDLRVYTSNEILEDHEAYLKARSMTRKVVGALTDDQATIDLYFGQAAMGCGALWVHVPEKHDASRAMRYLSEHSVLHYRYFGGDEEQDIHVREAGA